MISEDLSTAISALYRADEIDAIRIILGGDRYDPSKAKGPEDIRISDHDQSCSNCHASHILNNGSVECILAKDRRYRVTAEYMHNWRSQTCPKPFGKARVSPIR